jgi:hypothetical protein
MKKIIIFFSIFFLVFISHFSYAETLQPAKALVPVFAAAAESINKGEKSNENALFGKAFTLGLSQGLTLSKVLNSDNQSIGKDTLCIPDNINANDLILIIAKWLKEHPENHDKLAIGEIFFALNSAFPCSNN